MENSVDKIVKVWQNLPFQRILPNDYEISPQEINNRLAQIFSPGPFYFFLFNFVDYSINYMHHSIETVLGIKAEEVNNLQVLANLLYPGDFEHVQVCEKKAGEFLFQYIPTEHIPKYKVVYAYRLKKHDGQYATILSQSVSLALSKEKMVSVSLVVHADISHIVDIPNRSISFMGLEGVPSFTKMDPYAPGFIAPKDPYELSRREVEVLRLIAEGFSESHIAERLFLSVHTIRTHRRNIREKMNADSVAAAVAMAVRVGII